MIIVTWWLGVVAAFAPASHGPPHHARLRHDHHAGASRTHDSPTYIKIDPAKMRDKAGGHQKKGINIQAAVARFCSKEWRKRVAAKNQMVRKIARDLPTNVHALVDGGERPDFRKFDHLFKRENSVLIIGNGPVVGNHDAEVEKFDVVVRMNFYPEHAPGTGHKTDIHLSNLAHGMKTFEELQEFRTNRHLQNTLGVTLECHQFELNYMQNSSGAHLHDVYPLKQEWMKDLCHPLPWVRDGNDPSRGLMAILLFKQLFDEVHLLGFRGKGHNWKESTSFRWNHDIEAEHALIAQWIKERNSGIKSFDDDLEIDPSTCESYRLDENRTAHGAVYAFLGRGLRALRGARHKGQ